jgi:hypothetical protein
MAFIIFNKEVNHFYEVFKLNDDNLRRIERAHNDGLQDVELIPINISDDKYLFIYNPKFDTGYVVNQNIAKYYNLNSVRREGDFMQVKLKQPVASGYTVAYKNSGTGKKSIESAFIYNNYDGNSLFFKYPLHVDSIIEIQFGDHPYRVFNIESFILNVSGKTMQLDGNELANSLVSEQLGHKQCIFKDNYLSFQTSDSCKSLKFVLPGYKLAL